MTNKEKPIEEMTQEEARKPRQMAAESNIEDAIACAMSEGIRIGWDAHKKMVEEKTKS